MVRLLQYIASSGSIPVMLRGLLTHGRILSWVLTACRARHLRANDDFFRTKDHLETAIQRWGMDVVSPTKKTKVIVAFQTRDTATITVRDTKSTYG